jgi:hypothetical protein
MPSPIDRIVTMRGHRSTGFITIILAVSGFIGTSTCVHAQGRSSRQRENRVSAAARDDSTLRMSRAVACRSVEGYELYEILPGAALTSEEKLQVYYLPHGYKVVSRGSEYLAHFTQDGQIRRKGEKVVLRRKKNILDYEAKSDRPLEFIFIKNSVPLKGLPPGKYEYDIILRDANSPGSVATQSLDFTVIPPAQPGLGKE